MMNGTSFALSIKSEHKSMEDFMNKSIKTTDVEIQKIPKVSDDSFNGNLTAQPRAQTKDEHLAVDPNFVEESLEYGEMNERDAILSGYIDGEGKAVSKAKKDIEGRPTGAFTDIGHGRSSVVHSQDEDADDSEFDQRH